MKIRKPDGIAIFKKQTSDVTTGHKILTNFNGLPKFVIKVLQCVAPVGEYSF
jgi:hypothetical protein